MKKLNRQFSIVAFAALFFSLLAAMPLAALAQKQNFYQLKVYHLKDKEQEARLDQYIQQAYMPALHRAGISKVGVYKPIPGEGSNPTDEQLVYVFIPFTSADQFFGLDQKLEKDKQYAAAGQDYINATPATAPYARIESILMQAFTGMPSYKAPGLKSSPAERVYELRSYEAATEKLHQNKVDMFNNGEIKIFDKLGFNAVFYAKVLAGGKQPNLMYMTSFENKAERDAKWKAFGDDPDWKKLSGMSEYANNFLRADIYLLHPAPYSEI
ncbi:NIPSNAP family protein [Pontibacter sp. SGAir0037]|uniref:NIPSNAP family protein n=1 Tax=Pontibacter sp. SGAir0037 TaxID=2571030 RepID=UPI0010CCF291|nr:NIPSNAP family protein [Pontibacter sp. SGAir0037]QCR22122.1 NIPSNAP family containing protein [Pontibacter sp. SGAir0037]